MLAVSMQPRTMEQKSREIMSQVGSFQKQLLTFRADNRCQGWWTIGGQVLNRLGSSTSFWSNNQRNQRAVHPTGAILAAMRSTRPLLGWLLLVSSILPLRSIAQARSFEDRVESLWDRAYAEPDSVQQAARALLIDARRADSFHGTVNALELIGECHYYQLAMDSSDHYYQLALKEAQRKNELREEAHIHTSLGSIASELGKRDTALTEFDTALRIWEELKDTAMLCGHEIRLAGTYDRFDLDDLAMRHFVDGMRYCAAKHDSLFIAHALNGIGILHKKQRNYTKALAVLDSARVMYVRLGERFGSAGALNNLGVVYKSLHRYDDARRCYLDGLAIFEEDDYQRGIMSFSQNLGILENLEGRPEKGLAYCTRSLTIANEIGLAATRSEALNEIAKSLLMLDRSTAALDSVDKSIRIAQEAHLPDKEQQAWATRSDILLQLGRPVDAIAALERHQALKDSVFTMEKSAEIDRLQTVYETEERETTIAHLKEQALLEQARKRWLWVGIAAIGLAAFVVVMANLQRLRKDRQLHQAQLRMQELENTRLQEQLDHKRRELTEKALHLAQKNELLRGLELDIEQLRDGRTDANVAALAGKLRFDQQIDQNWEQFTLAFTETRGDFFKQLTARHPDLTRNELRLAALLSMNLGNKEVGTILNVSDEGVKKARYRLRKKIDMRTEDSLEQYLAGI